MLEDEGRAGEGQTDKKNKWSSRLAREAFHVPCSWSEKEESKEGSVPFGAFFMVLLFFLEKILLFSDLVLLKCWPQLKQWSWRCRMMVWTRSEMLWRGRRGKATTINRDSVLGGGKGWSKCPWRDIREADKGGRCYQVSAMLYGVRNSDMLGGACGTSEA